MSNRVYFDSVEQLEELLRVKGCEILAIVPNDSPEEYFDRIPGTKEPVRWTCARSSKHICVSTFANVKKALLDDQKPQILCQACAISKSRGGITFDTFVNMLHKQRWKMLSSKKDYTNTKTVLKVKCPEGHELDLNYNKFQSGRRCPDCESVRVSSEKLARISKEFEGKGFKLLATEYINNSEKMKCLCKCGREHFITYSNFQRNIDGCKSCTRRWTFADAKEYIEDQGCILKHTNGEDYVEFVLNVTKITYTCVCGTEHTATWRSFRKGCRCKKCTRILIEQTCLEIYGYKNASKSPQVKEKIVATMVKRYGVEYAMQIEENVNKAYATNLKNHGGVHNLTSWNKRSVQTYV
jgi:hypothetical protein